MFAEILNPRLTGISIISFWRYRHRPFPNDWASMNENICPNCQFPNRQGANFCAACGRSLNTTLRDATDESPTVSRGVPVDEAILPESLQTMRIQRSFDLRVGRRTNVGRLRESNEDSLLVLDSVWSNKSISRPLGLFVVADGMGGHEGGEIASGILVRTLMRRATEQWLPKTISSADEAIDAGAWLVGAIQAGNEEIFNWAQEAGFEMGTTIVAAVMEGDRVLVAHVGDSRAYRINSAGIERLTIDHSLVESLVLSHQISREEARDHPQANVIYRTVGDQREITVDLKQVQLAAGDFLLLCSDGLSGMIADDVIHELVINAGSPQMACDELVDVANQAGGEDNITVIVVGLESPS